MHRWIGLVLLSLCFVFYVGCESGNESESTDQLDRLHERVAVTNYPLYCIVSMICADTNCPVKEVVYVGPPPGANAHAWMPSSDQIRDLQKVDAIICNGPGAVFANWMDKVTIDQNKLCKTTDAIKPTEFVVVKDYQLVHSHGPEGEHSHSWVVPQSWLSPRIVRKQAAFCFDRLVSVYGESSQLSNGFADLGKRFDDLETALENVRAAAPKRIVASSTPDIQYLTRELGWTNRYLQWTEPRGVDKAKEELAKMKERVAKDAPNLPQNEQLFLWSGKPFEELTEVVGANWPSSIAIDLIGSPDEALSTNGYFDRMLTNIRRIGDSIE